MNYVKEIGLAHTEMVPVKKAYTPPKIIPMSGWGRRYMGLEQMSKKEINDLCSRLSKPKIGLKHESRETPTQRFTGNKRLGRKSINSIVERLSKGKTHSA